MNQPQEWNGTVAVAVNRTYLVRNERLTFDKQQVEVRTVVTEEGPHFGQVITSTLTSSQARFMADILTGSADQVDQTDGAAL